MKRVLAVALCISVAGVSVARDVCTVTRVSSNDTVTAAIINCKPEVSFKDGETVIIFAEGGSVDIKPLKVYERKTTPMNIEGC